MMRMIISKYTEFTESLLALQLIIVKFSPGASLCAPRVDQLHF